MEKLKNLGSSLSRDEMRNVVGGISAGFHTCFYNPDCNYQSPTGTPCNDGTLPTCRKAFCTTTENLTSTDWVWGCGIG